MFEAQLLNNNSAVFSPWMRRGGDNLIITCEVVDANLVEEFYVAVFEKNSETPGNGVINGATLQFNAAGILSTPDTAPHVGMLEMVRYKFYFNTAQSGDWVLFRMLAPTWYNAVDA